MGFLLFKKNQKLLVISLLLAFSINGQAKQNQSFEAKRIIALSPHAVELLYAIGAGDRIVGTVEYADYPKEALSIPRIGNYVGIKIEKVLALKPDLIVIWKNGNKTTDLNKLKSLGLTIHNSQSNNIIDITKDLQTLGELTGLQDNAKKIIEKMKSRYEKIVTRYSNKSEVNVFYQVWHEPLMSVGANGWIESLIKNCGGKNIFDQSDTPYPQVSLESVLAKNPEVIIIPHHSGNVGAKTEIWEKWPEITAIKNNQYFILDGDLLHRYTPRALDGLELLCNRIDRAR